MKHDLKAMGLPYHVTFSIAIRVFKVFQKFIKLNSILIRRRWTLERRL